MSKLSNKINFSDADGVIGRLVFRVFVNDWQLKLVALVVTLALWIGVTGLKTPTTARMKGVALILNVQGDVEATSSVEFVDLVVSGDKRKVDLLNPRNLVASLDLSNVPQGERSVQVTTDNLNIRELPNGVKLEAVEPAAVQVTLERILERSIPVKVETQGAVAPGFEFYSASASPATVTVRGPESRLKGVESVVTEKVSIKGRQTGFPVTSVELQPLGPRIRIGESSVSVNVSIGEKRVERQVTVPVTVDGKKRNAVLTLYGPTDVFAVLKPEDIEVQVTSSSDGSQSVSVDLPGSIRDSVEVRRKVLR